jgi:8-oxo-dGTP pyrophosphatase MutT (NUDIX family)
MEKPDLSSLELDPEKLSALSKEILGHFEKLNQKKISELTTKIIGHFEKLDYRPTVVMIITFEESTLLVQSAKSGTYNPVQGGVDKEDLSSDILEIFPNAIARELMEEIGFDTGLIKGIEFHNYWVADKKVHAKPNDNRSSYQKGKAYFEFRIELKRYFQPTEIQEEEISSTLWIPIHKRKGVRRIADITSKTRRDYFHATFHRLHKKAVRTKKLAPKNPAR